MPNENEIYVNLDIVHGLDDNIEVYKGDTGRVLKILSIIPLKLSCLAVGFPFQSIPFPALLKIS